MTWQPENYYVLKSNISFNAQAIKEWRGQKPFEAGANNCNNYDETEIHVGNQPRSFMSRNTLIFSETGHFSFLKLHYTEFLLAVSLFLVENINR